MYGDPHPFLYVEGEERLLCFCEGKGLSRFYAIFLRCPGIHEIFLRVFTYTSRYAISSGEPLLIRLLLCQSWSLPFKNFFWERQHKIFVVCHGLSHHSSLMSPRIDPTVKHLFEWLLRMSPMCSHSSVLSISVTFWKEFAVLWWAFMTCFSHLLLIHWAWRNREMVSNFIYTNLQWHIIRSQQ